jgi:hypothetical protein
MSKTTVKRSRRAVTNPIVDHPVARLSFVASRDGMTLPKWTEGQLPRCFWHVKPTGDRLADEATGHVLALECLAYQEADSHGLPLPPGIVADMPRKLTGVEIGFLSVMSHAARAGVGAARELVAYWERCRKEEGRT